MHRSRLVIAACCMLLLGLSLGVPTAALAGGSAGDQQYTDPFGGSTTSAPATTSTTTAQTQTITQPAATTAAAADPAATTAATTSTSAATLPYSGYDAWTATGFGATLLAAGVALRRRTRARPRATIRLSPLAG